MRAFGVSILIYKGGKCLGVARRKDPNDFGLPGGKVDETDASEEAAAIRECLEETGLTISNLKEVYRGYCGKDIGVTFTCDWKGEPSSQPGEPECRWVTPEVLMKGVFGEYNTELFKQVKLT